MTPVEHVKHPQQRRRVMRHVLVRADAAAYGARLVEEGAAFAAGSAPLPPELWHYNVTRTTRESRRVARRLLRDDPPGAACGVP